MRCGIWRNVQSFGWRRREWGIKSSTLGVVTEEARQTSLAVLMSEGGGESTCIQLAVRWGLKWKEGDTFPRTEGGGGEKTSEASGM